MHKGEFLFQRNFLHSLKPPATSRRQCPCLNAAIINNNGAARSRHISDACDDGAARNRFFLIHCVQQISCEIPNFEKRHPGVQQARQTLAREKLTSLFKTRFFGRRARGRAGIKLI